MFRLRWFGLWAGLWLSVLAPVFAQASTPTPQATLTAVETSAFPQITVFASVADETGAHWPGLSASAFTLLENGRPLTPLTVTAVEAGLQVVFVLDTSAAFKARDANGLTRLDHARAALLNFTDTLMRDGVDDVTVLTPESLLIAHSTTGREVAAALNAYSSTFTGAADPLAIVNAALDYAASIAPRPGMRAVVIVISNGYSGAGLESQLNDVGTRALAARVLIHTAFVGPLGAGNTANAQNLRALAAQSGGQSVLNDTATGLDPVLRILADQRQRYQLTYRSRITSTGQHNLSAQVALTSGLTLATTDFIFPLRVEPPQLKLGDITTALTLTLSPDGQSADPSTFAIPYTIDFTDNHPRTVRSAQLQVNTETWPARTAPPFAVLDWPLAHTLAAGEYVLTLTIEDELGLSATALHTVTLFVNALPAPLVSQTAPLDANGRVVVSALMPWLGVGVIGLALVGLGAWGWQRARRVSPHTGRTVPGPASRTTPVQVVRAVVAEPPPLNKTAPLVKSPPRTRPRLRFNTKPFAPKRPHPTSAYLEVIEAGGGGAPMLDVVLPEHPLYLGRDAAVAEIVFPDRSVSRRHARIERAPTGAYYIYDEGSTSGTWVNYTMIASEVGYELKPADLINLGRVQLRFKLPETPTPEKPA